jgi:uncharacterized protein YdhG (YjbR/CyaY superfamily)
MEKVSKIIPAKNMDEYIAGFPHDIQKMLTQVRTIVKKIAPGAEETITYNMPTFKLNGNYLIYFAGWKNHISLYPFSAAMEASFKEASSYKTSGKGTIQFPANKPLPVDLITKIVQFRVKENLESTKAKTKKK